ncbi:MAG: hypothetical protein HQL86_08500 [Magnetococcales bacterium]|nr:hypothetical protein [Magnetococcales bacterium]
MAVVRSEPKRRAAVSAVVMCILFLSRCRRRRGARVGIGATYLADAGSVLLPHLICTLGDVVKPLK